MRLLVGRRRSALRAAAGSVRAGSALANAGADVTVDGGGRFSAFGLRIMAPRADSFTPAHPPSPQTAARRHHSTTSLCRVGGVDLLAPDRARQLARIDAIGIFDLLAVWRDKSRHSAYRRHRSAAPGATGCCRAPPRAQPPAAEFAGRGAAHPTASIRPRRCHRRLRPTEAQADTGRPERPSTELQLSTSPCASAVAAAMRCPLIEQLDRRAGIGAAAQ